MVSYDSKEIETVENAIISKKIEIEQNLNCFLIVGSKNKKILTPLANKIVDYILDNITLKDTYNKLSVTLESINFFIKNLRKKEDFLDDLSIIIWVLEKNNFHFSKIWEASCHLINKNNEFLEISDPSNKIKEFDFISSWKLSNNEKVVLSNKRIWDFITQSDLNELAHLSDISDLNSWIINILNDEKIKEDIKISSISYEVNWETTTEKKAYIEKTKHTFYSFFDNDLSKKAIAMFLILKERLEKESKITKNIVFVGWILISVFLLYSILSWIIWKTIEWWKTWEYKNYLIEAREYLRAANENISNPENFELNIKKSEELITKVKEENLFLNDVTSIENDISIIKKQFNWIETFDTVASNLLFKWNFSDWVKLLVLDKKLFVVWKSAVYWPIVQWQEIWINTYEWLEIDDEFIDGSIAWNDVILVTKKWRVVKLSRDLKFSYVNVLWQNTWQETPIVEAYNSNIYITNKAQNQVYMHSPAQNWFNAGVSYLNDADVKNIWKILAIWIDWWIYMLKNDLTLVKFFRAPKYRLESIVLNKLPKNYVLENPNVKIITQNNLSYIYMLLNNKIWVFQPNTKIFSDTKSLTYIWQIEWKSEQIISFAVQRDNEVQVLTKSWIYKVWFDIKDGKVILR